MIQAKLTKRCSGLQKALPYGLIKQPVHLTAKILLASNNAKECLKLAQVHDLKTVKQECYLVQCK